MHIVKKINYVDGYKISLTFNDKKTKMVDLERYLDKGVFLPLRDPTYFKTVSLAGGTIAWPNEADFCPDVLYEIGMDGSNEVTKKTKKTAPSRTRRTKSGLKHT